METSEHNIISVAEAAKRKNVSRQGIHHSIKAGHFTVVNISGRIFLLDDEKFDAWMAMKPGRQKK